MMKREAQRATDIMTDRVIEKNKYRNKEKKRETDREKERLEYLDISYEKREDNSVSSE